MLLLVDCDFQVPTNIFALSFCLYIQLNVSKKNLSFHLYTRLLGSDLVCLRCVCECVCVSICLIRSIIGMLLHRGINIYSNRIFFQEDNDSIQWENVDQKDAKE